MSKLKGGQVAVWATRSLMDLVGPYAYTHECPLEKWFRDAKIYELFEGTAEIQRLVISRMQVADYADRLQDAAKIAAQATNGAGPTDAPAEVAAEVASSNGAGEPEPTATVAR
jgi:hypothetical protein